MVRTKRKDVAKYLLRQEHMFRKYWDKFAILKYQLESQLLTIDTLEANHNLVKAFKMAEDAHKSIKTDLNNVEELLSNLKEYEEDQDKLNELINEHVEDGMNESVN